ARRQRRRARDLVAASRVFLRGRPVLSLTVVQSWGPQCGASRRGELLEVSSAFAARAARSPRGRKSLGDASQDRRAVRGPGLRPAAHPCRDALQARAAAHRHAELFRIRPSGGRAAAAPPHHFLPASGPRLRALGARTWPGGFTIVTGMSPAFACPDSCGVGVLPPPRDSTVIATIRPEPLRGANPKKAIFNLPFSSFQTARYPESGLTACTSGIVI